MNHSAIYLFMENLIDYAGMYPPARLPLTDALQRYLSYRKNKYSTFLSRFICPAGKLDELSTRVSTLMADEKPVVLSVTGQPHESTAEFLSGLQGDIGKMERLYRRRNNRVTIDFYEIKFPAELLEKPAAGEIQSFLKKTTGLFQENFDSPVRLFFEGDFRGNWEERLTAIFNGFRRYRESAPEQTGSLPGFKIRCGGETLDAYPSPAQVAFTLVQTAHYRIPLKATAGLHHPIRHFNKAAGVQMHGFINLFGTGILLYHSPQQAYLAREIIEDEIPAHFQFNERGFFWKDLFVPVKTIREARSRFLISYGSCNFEEPIQDLADLGYFNQTE